MNLALARLLRRLVAPRLGATHLPRRPQVADPVPPPLLTFGLTVAGHAVRGRRWGLGAAPTVYLVSGRPDPAAPSGGTVRSLLAAGYGVVALDAAAEVLDLALATVEARHGPAYAVLDAGEPGQVREWSRPDRRR